MKKILFGTTALVSIAGFAFSANAEAPRVSVGGHSVFAAGFSDQELDEGTTTSRDIKFVQDTEIVFSIDGKSDTGLAYGAVIELEADQHDSLNNEGINADKSFIYLEGNFGRAELGNTAGPSDTMKVDAGSISRATGGVNGLWYHFVETDAGWYQADLPIAWNDTEADATRIVYYTPRFSGFQLGVSYIPDTGDGSSLAPFSGENNPGDYENAFEAAINYENQFDDITVGFSATGQFGDAEDTATGAADRSEREDLSSYAFGAHVGYMGFSLAGSYGLVGDIGGNDIDTTIAGATSTFFEDAQFWNLGLAYDFGPFGVSADYFASEYDNVTKTFDNGAEVSSTSGGDTETELYSFGVDYQLAPGFVPYAEVTFFDIEDQNADYNDGTVFMVGSALAF